MKLTLDTLHMYCDEEGDCLLWKLSAKKGAHPQARLDGKVQLVGRYVYTVLMGRQLANGHRVSPKCGNPLCIAPGCLQQQTYSTILKRSYATGKRSRINEYAARVQRAKDQGWVKLTLADVQAIRLSDEPHTVLAERYDVHRKTIADARAGVHWRVQGSSVFDLGRLAA
jgi:hypothetical protein